VVEIDSFERITDSDHSSRQKWCPASKAGLFKTIGEHTAAELFDAAIQDRSTSYITMRVGVDRRAKRSQPGFTENYQTCLRHWRLNKSIIQRGVTSDNRSRPLAFFPKTVCRVSSRRGASIDVVRFESENKKYFTLVAESADKPPCIIQILTQQMHFGSGVQSLLPSRCLRIATANGNLQ